jgi:DNA-binding transcriptional LysR family regulator
MLISVISLSYDADMITDQFRSITLQQLEALVTLVEERSFSEAAKKMLLSQPSMSKHIKNLETFVNRPLINRTKTGISLTQEGSILYGYAKKVLRLRDEAREKILSLEDTVSGHVFIGTSTIPSTYILPPVLSGLRKTFPDIQAHILSSDSDEVIDMVLGGQVEIGFIGKNIRDRRLHCEPLWDDELILVAPGGHRIGELRQARIENLLQEPFILREKGSGTRSIFESYLNEHGLPHLSRFSISCELGSSEAVKEAVIAGLGISVLSIHAVRREIGQGLLTSIPLQPPRILRSFAVIYRKQFVPLPHHRAFLEYAKVWDPDRGASGSGG